MKKEYALEILLSNPILNQTSLKRVEHILKESVDWNQVFSISLEDRTTFIMCKNLLEHHYCWMIPDSLWLVWHTAYKGNTEKNKQLLNYYNILERKFREKNIVAVPSGGIMLLSTIYKDMVGVRLLHDIDFFSEKKYLHNIDQILNDSGFKKIYTDNKDPLMNPTNIYGNDNFYSKYINCCFINCDFCCGIEKNAELFSFLMKCLESREIPLCNVAQLILLYLSAAKSWNGNYYVTGIKQYTYAKLIDIQLYQKFYAGLELASKLKEVTSRFYLDEIITEVNIALDFFQKGGYLA